MSSAVVVGSGLNGLAAAARLARAGLDVTVLEASDSIGGGRRSSEMIVPGLVHDHCSAFHPIAAASPFLASLSLESRGSRGGSQRWTVSIRWTTVRPASSFDRSIDRTVEGLGIDGARWRRVFEPSRGEKA